MANTPVKDGNGSLVYLSSTGTGAVGDPYIPSRSVTAITSALPAGTNTLGAVLSPTVTADATITGIGTVTGAGTPVQGGSVTNANGFILKGHPDNTDTFWIFYWGQTKASGFPLNSKEAIIVPVSNLNVLGFDADVSGEKVCWIKA